MLRLLLTVAAPAIFLAVSCSGMHPPTLDEDFIDCGDITLRECADDTIKALRTQIRSDPDAPEAYRRLAVCYRAVGTPESRLLSLQAIEKALELDPENPSYHVEMGLTQYARQFTGSAVASLDKAIELDPGCFQAWFHKGRIEKDLYLRNMCSEKHLDNAIRCFGRANNIRGDHQETLFDLGLLQYLRERFDVCVRCARAGEAHHPGSYRFRLLSSSVDLERNRFDAACSGFDSALVMMDADTRYMYEDVSLLLPMEERYTYLNLDERNRNEFNRKFWIMNDPTPATIVNERRLEHYKRVFLCTELLTDRRLGLEGVQTARGRALVSYGLPPLLLLKIGSGVDGPFVVWTYLQGDKMFMLYFQDEFLNGNYHIPIDRKFYDYAMITEGILQSVQQMYTYPVDYTHIPLVIENVQFRGSGDKTRVDFAVALPDSLIASGAGSYNLDFTLFDNDWKVFLSESRSFDPDTLRHFKKSSVYWRLFPFTMELPPLQLQSSFAVEITGGKPPGRAVRRNPLTIRDLGGNNLSLSGLRLSLRDEEGVCTDLMDPLPSYAAGSALCVSYEIYNLRRNTENIARYRMTWSVTSNDETEGPSGTWDWITASVRGSKPGPRVYISSSIEQMTSERSTSDDLMLDAASLEPGRYLLILEIEDLVAGFKVSGERPFAIIPRTGS